MFAAFGKHRYLLGLLVIREIRIRYARAALGIAWALFMPLAMMAVFTVLNFGRLIADTSEYKALPYSVFAYCGLLFWTHFATSLTQGTPSLVISSSVLMAPLAVSSVFWDSLKSSTLAARLKA